MDYQLKKLKSLPKLFDDKESSSNILLGASFSGKTTLLREIIEDIPKNTFDRIFILTGSPDVAMLKGLNNLPNVKGTVKVFPRFVPTIIRTLDMIQTITKRYFRFLVICDDILKTRNHIIEHLLLTLRNQRIDSIISTQYSKLITPASRGSTHRIFILSQRPEQLHLTLQMFGLFYTFKSLYNSKDKEYIMSRVSNFFGKHGVIIIDNRINTIFFLLRK